MTIENLSDIPAPFSLCEAGFAPFEYSSQDDHHVEASENGVLSFYPGVGVLAPHSRRDVTVVFRPHQCQRLRTFVQVHVQHTSNRPPIQVSVRGEVQVQNVK